MDKRSWHKNAIHMKTTNKIIFNKQPEDRSFNLLTKIIYSSLCRKILNS